MFSPSDLDSELRHATQKNFNYGTNYGRAYATVLCLSVVCRRLSSSVVCDVVYCD